MASPRHPHNFIHAGSRRPRHPRNSNRLARDILAIFCTRAPAARGILAIFFTRAPAARDIPAILHIEAAGARDIFATSSTRAGHCGPDDDDDDNHDVGSRRCVFTWSPTVCFTWENHQPPRPEVGDFPNLGSLRSAGACWGTLGASRELPGGLLGPPRSLWGLLGGLFGSRRAFLARLTPSEVSGPL